MIRQDFLPTTKADMLDRDWHWYDFLLVTGDAYVDHPSFGVAVIGRLLESRGFRVAVLAQPGWKNAEAFTSLGRPRLAVMISAGNLDSMVAHYTASKKKRNQDFYSPGKAIGKRPDRASIVYSNRAREAFGSDMPIILGGLEASLRRFAHYDYWDNKVRRGILFDAAADMLVYGMGERAVIDIAARLKKGEPINRMRDIPGTAFIVSDLDSDTPSMSAKGGQGQTDLDTLSRNSDAGAEVENSQATPSKTVSAQAISTPILKNAAMCPSFEEVKADRYKYADATKLQYELHDAISGRILIQPHEHRYLVVMPPQMPLDTEMLDKVAELPYLRAYHPDYDSEGGVPALDEVRFSIIHNRGCFGACNFCSLAWHQGRMVTSRSHASVLKEAELLTHHEDFKGYIHDVGGPTAQFRTASCDVQKDKGMCTSRKCLTPTPCKKLKVDHSDYLALLRKIRNMPKIKKVFVRSGIRFDYMMADPDTTFFRELVAHHISGQLKVAPEHCVDHILDYMGKPHIEVYRRFMDLYAKFNQSEGKNQFLVPYLMSSHPGSTLSDAVELAEFLHREGARPEQVQDFYPTPGTISTCMYFTGIDPFTKRPVYVARTPHEKELQRALLQYFLPENRDLVAEALRKAHRLDLIGHDPKCLIRPPRKSTAEQFVAKTRAQKIRQGTKRSFSGDQVTGKPGASKKPTARHKPDISNKPANRRSRDKGRGRV